MKVKEVVQYTSVQSQQKCGYFQNLVRICLDFTLKKKSKYFDTHLCRITEEMKGKVFQLGGQLMNRRQQATQNMDKDTLPQYLLT